MHVVLVAAKSSRSQPRWPEKVFDFWDQGGEALLFNSKLPTSM
jgi:hypothetical protein